MTLLRRLACALPLLALGCHPLHGTGMPDGAPPPPPSSDGGGGTLAARQQAVAETISQNSACNTLPAFYWEIGDVSGALASGSVGTGFAADTEMAIASASKFLWGAYVVERFKADLSQINLKAMTLSSGYVSFTDCGTTTTVADCLASGMNGTYTAADDGKFDYGGGHFQKYAVDLGLGGDDDAALAGELKKYLGTDLTFTFSTPQPAGGIRTTPADYAAFLRKILSGTLALHDHLGENAVCTLPSACPTAVYSPAPAAWHYSYGHWVEDDPSGDGAFSSPGKFGFYGWIDASKTYYGILARLSLQNGAYLDSAICGALLRKAFLTGTPQ